MRPFPLGAPHPSPVLLLPCASPSTVLTPKSFPGGFNKAFGVGWGVFGGQILLCIPTGQSLVPSQTPSPLQALPVGFNFWGYFRGFFIIISKWPFEFSTSGSALEGVFRFLYLLVLYGGEKNHRNKPIRCSLYTVLWSFSEGREIFPQRQSWFSSLGRFLGLVFFLMIIFLSSL